MVEQAYSPSLWEAEAEGSWIQGLLDPHTEFQGRLSFYRERPFLKTKLKKTNLLASFIFFLL